MQSQDSDHPEYLPSLKELLTIHVVFCVHQKYRTQNKANTDLTAEP